MNDPRPWEASASRPAPWRPTVLVAEDDAELNELICQMLRQHGCEVESFGDGDALWRALAHRNDCLGVPPDLIVSDVRMPGHSGLDVLEQLRRYDRVTPVILVTAFAEQHWVSQAESLGAAVIDKPFDLEQLRHAAQQCGVLP